VLLLLLLPWRVVPAAVGGGGGGATTQQLGRDLARSSTSWGGRRYEEASGWEAEEAVEGEEEVVWTLSSEDEWLLSLSSSTFLDNSNIAGVE